MPTLRRWLQTAAAVLVVTMPMACRAMEPELTDPEVNLLMNVLIGENPQLYEHYLAALTTTTSSIQPVYDLMKREEAFVRNLPDAHRAGLTTAAESMLLNQGLALALEAETTPPTRQELAQLYERRADDFQVPELRSVRHVEFPVGQGAGAEEEARTSASEWRRRLIETKGDFDTEADRLWQGKPDDGRLGPFDEHTHRGIHTREAFALRLNEMSQPVRSKDAYHIFKLTSVTLQRQQPMDEVLPQLERMHAEIAVRDAELAFFRNAVGPDVPLSAPFTRMESFTRLPPESVLFQIGDLPPLKWKDCDRHLRTVGGFETIDERLCPPTIRYLVRAKCLEIPSVRAAARQVPRIRRMASLLESGEAAMRWRAAHIKPPDPTKAQIKAYYDAHLDVDFRNPPRYWASLLLIRKALMPERTSETVRYQAAGEWDAIQERVGRDLSTGKPVAELLAELKPHWVKLDRIELEGGTMREASPLFGAVAKQGVTGRWLGPARDRSEALFALVHRVEPGEPVPLGEVEEGIAVKLKADAVRTEWNRILSGAQGGTQ